MCDLANVSHSHVASLLDRWSQYVLVFEGGNYWREESVGVFGDGAADQPEDPEIQFVPRVFVVLDVQQPV